MNCEKARELISQYIDNELTKEEKIDFEDHIKGCKGCYEEYRSLLEVVSKVNGIQERPLPDNFRSELKWKLEKEVRATKKQKSAHQKFKFSKWTSVAAILLVGIVIVAVLSGQYSPLGKSSMDSAGSAPDEAREEGFEADFDMTTQDEASGRANDMTYDIQKQLEAESTEYTSDNKEDVPSNMPNMQEKIIYSARLTIQVNDLDKVFKRITNYTEEVGGFIQNSYTNNPQNNVHSNTSPTLREGYIYIRIPSDKFEEAISSIGEMGNIIENQRNGENITTQYRDIQAEVNNLEVQEERILEIMKKAEKVEDILNIESELNRIRTEINQRKNTLKNWDQLVDYSSIEVDMWEEKFSTTSVQGGPFKELGQKIQRGFIQSINLIVEGVAKIIIFIARAIPFFIILIALYMIYRKWFRARLLARIKKH